MESLRDSKDLRNLPAYSPDFSVRAITAVQYLRIRRVHYLAARRTTYMMTSTHEADRCHEDAFHKEWHRTVASSSISRNNSAAGISDLADPSLSPLEMVQKRALLSEGSLKEKAMGAGTPKQPAPREVEVDEAEKEESKDEKAVADSPKADKDAEKKGKDLAESDKATGDAVSDKERTCAGDKDQDTATLLQPSVVGDGDQNAVDGRTESDSSPDEGGVGKGMGDKIPLVNTKEGSRTTLSGQRGWAEDEDESSPLVGKENSNGKTVKL